jgi:hypothetical protein
MNSYEWMIICDGFGTSYIGKTESTNVEEAMKIIIEDHEKNYNHYGYNVIMTNNNGEKLCYEIVCGNVKKKKTINQ